MLLLSGSIILYTNQNGVNLTFDSYKYIRQAGELRTDFWGFFREHWPLQTLIPLLLSVSIEDACLLATSINGIAILGTQFLWMRMGGSRLTDDWTRRFFFVSVALSTPFLLDAAFLWTEAIYLLILSSLIWALPLTTQQWSLPRVGWLVLLCLLLLLARKAALVSFLGLGLFTVWQASKSPQAIRRGRYGVWVLIGGMFGYLLYLTFDKFSPDTMLSNLGACFHYVGLWFLPKYAYWGVPLALTAFWWTSPRTSSLSAFDKLCLVLLVTGVLARIPLYRGDLTEFDRYMSVLYPMGIFLFYRFLNEVRTAQWSRAIYGLGVVIVLYQLVRMLKNAILWQEGGCWLS